MGKRLCRTWSLWFLTGVRPVLSSRRFVRSSAAGCLHLSVRDRRLPVYSLCSRGRRRSLCLKMRSRKFPSASRLRLSKRKKFIFAGRLSRHPRHEPRVDMSSSGSRAAKRRCVGQQLGGPGQRIIQRPRAAAKRAASSAMLQGVPFTLRGLTFKCLLRRSKAGMFQALPVPGQRRPSQGRRKGPLPKRKKLSRRPGPGSKIPGRR